MNLTDASIKTGQSYEISGFKDEPQLRDRLHEMGLREGLTITLIGRAPFGGPLLIRFNASFLAVRKEEAQCILLK